MFDSKSEAQKMIEKAIWRQAASMAREKADEEWSHSIVCNSLLALARTFELKADNV